MAILPSFDNTLGALFIGFSVSTMLYGMLLIQGYNYYRRYPLDRPGYKTVVAVLLLLETAHQAFIGHAVYYYTITNFLNLLALLDRPIWSIVFQLLTGAVVGTIVKFFFTLRVWRFSYGNMWLTAFLLLLTFGQLGEEQSSWLQTLYLIRVAAPLYHQGLAIAYTVKSYELSTMPAIINLRVLGTVALGIGVLNDIGIAIALCYYLQSMRSSYTQSDSIIRSLTIYAINTGVLTSAMSFTTLIIYNFQPKNFIFVGCYFVLSKLYAVSFVAALNTRQIIRGRGTDGEPKRSPNFQVVTETEQQSRSLDVQVQPSRVTKDASEMECGREENAPRSNEDWEGRRPYYTVGW